MTGGAEKKQKTRSERRKGIGAVGTAGIEPRRISLIIQVTRGSYRERYVLVIIPNSAAKIK